MTQHLHTEHMDGCFRCDLSRDESEGEAILDEINALVDRLVERRSSLRFAALRHGYIIERRD